MHFFFGFSAMEYSNTSGDSRQPEVLLPRRENLSGSAEIQRGELGGNPSQGDERNTTTSKL